MKKTQSVASRAVALGLGLAMIGGVSIAAAAPAQADDVTTVYASDIAGYSSPSPAGWSQGYEEGQFTITDEGLALAPVSQVAYHYEAANRLDAGPFAGLVDTGQVSWTTTDASDPAYFQVPFFYGDLADPSYTTLRPADPVVGANIATLDGTWMTSQAITNGDDVIYEKNATASLTEFLDAMGTAGNVQVLGFGVVTAPDTESVVTGITFGSSTYTFAPDAPVVPVTPVVPTLTAGTVSISGTVAEGNTLTAVTAGWPAGTTFSYNWGAVGAHAQNSGDIEGAHASTLVVTKEMVNKSIWVNVTGSKDGYQPSMADAQLPFPKLPAAAAPVADSSGLAAYLAANEAPVQPQTSTGLPAGELNPDSDYTATVTWYAGDSFVDVYLYSTPILVGTFPVVDGVAQITLRADVLSRLAADDDTLVVVGQASGAVQAFAISVAATLASTGINAAAPMGLAALLLLLGAALVIARRRRVHV